MNTYTLEEYKEAVRFLASTHRNFDIKNEGNEHARIVLTNLFLNAKKEVRIVANTLRNEVVDSREYQDALDSFLGRVGAKLQIIINQLPDNANEEIITNIYRRLRLNPAYEEGRIVIKVAGENRFFLGKKPVNLCVADSLMYRIEDDIEKRTAVCNFGNAKKAAGLEAGFDNVFSSIREVVDLKKLFA